MLHSIVLFLLLRRQMLWLCLILLMVVAHGKTILLSLLLLLIVEVVVVVPGFRTAWVALRQHKDQVVCAQLDALLWVRDHVLDLFQLLGGGRPNLAIIAHTYLVLFIILVELVVVYHLATVESDRDHETTRCQIVEEARVLAVRELVRHLYMV